MEKRWACSELDEAGRLWAALTAAPAAAGPLVAAPPAVATSAPGGEQWPGMDPGAGSTSREERLVAVLAELCAHGGYQGAVLADASGLPIAAHQSPVAVERLAACISALGESSHRAGLLLDQRDAQVVAVDLDGGLALSLHRCEALGGSYGLAAIGPRGHGSPAALARAAQAIAAELADAAPPPSAP